MNKLMLICAAVALAACSHKPEAVSNVSQGEAKPVTSASIESKQIAAEQESPYVVEVEFQKGNSKLGIVQQNKINRLLARAQKSGQIDEAKVISWADQEYPSKDVKELSQDQRKLAENRNKEIKSYLQNHQKDLKVQTLSMAERPEALAKFFGTDEARIKKSFEMAGLPEKGKKSGSSTASSESKASKAVVMFSLKDKKNE